VRRFIPSCRVSETAFLLAQAIGINSWFFGPGNFFVLGRRDVPQMFPLAAGSLFNSDLGAGFAWKPLGLLARTQRSEDQCARARL